MDEENKVEDSSAGTPVENQETAPEVAPEEQAAEAAPEQAPEEVAGQAEVPPEEVVEEGEDEEVDAVPVLKYEGKTVISSDVREVEGHEWHTLRLSDGSTVDVTGEQFEAIVGASKN